MPKSVYLNQRIRKETVKRLRKYEKKNGLKASISATIDQLLERSDGATHCAVCSEFSKSLENSLT